LTQNQRIRAELLFTNYPLYIKHKHTLEFRNIYEETSRELIRKNSELDEKTKLLEMTVLIPHKQFEISFGNSF
jgi:hypothetical protein